MVTMTARQFNQNPSAAQRATADGPVVITDRGRPAYVLQRYEAFRESVAKSPSLSTALVMETYVEFEPQRSRELPREVDL
jgi:PHD/YefM family antitoxin component YafN of YafNO toxin-antitoxin module